MFRMFAHSMNMTASASAAEARCCASFALLILTGAICLAPVIFIILLVSLVLVGILVSGRGRPKDTLVASL